GLTSSRFGPTVAVAPASFRVWQPTQPALAKTVFPAAGSPAGAGRGFVDVGFAGVSCGVVSTAAATSFRRSSFGSLASAMIVPSMSAVKPTLTATNHRTLLPGKPGFIFGNTNDDSSANPTKIAAATRMPIL